MSKKGLFSSLIIALVVTLTLGIYTIASVVGFGGKQDPENQIFEVAYRTGDTVDVLEGYSVSNNTLKITLPEGEEISPIVPNPETGKYQVVYEGEATAVVKLNKEGDTITYIIKTYKQGTGASISDAYVLANASHMKEFASLVNSGESIPAYTKLVHDIDLAGEAWMPIGTEANPYSGNFEGNDKVVKNLGISVDASNYVDYVVSADAGLDTVGFIDLGLFGKTVNATINNVNLSNATISVNSNLYEILSASTGNEVYANRISRLSVGALVGSAYQTDIIGKAEEYSNIVANINAYSYAKSADGAFAGVGGVVGGSSLTRISNYDVTVDVVNNQSATKYSNIGGVVGSITSMYAVDNSGNIIETVSADDKSVIENVNVNFKAEVVYNNAAYVAGIVGNAKNLSILNSTVASFIVNDLTDENEVVYGESEVTLATGVVSVLLTEVQEVITDNAVKNAFASKIEEVSVLNSSVNMLGGDAAGVVGILGGNDVNKPVSVKNTTVVGDLNANTVAGFVWIVNPSATVSYDKAYENAVVDVNIEAQMSAGFVFSNYGKISGYASDLTKIIVDTVGLHADINTSDPTEKVNQRNATYASGFVVRTYSKVDGVIPTIENFDIDFYAIDSINMAGVAITLGQANIKNLKVVSDITSYSYQSGAYNYSTTYSVAGVACVAQAGANIDNVNVVINANKNIENTENKYAASFFGGVVARYLGDEDTLGLTINNCVISGQAYFNDSNENATFNGVSDKVFIAGGVVGAMEGGVGTAVDQFSSILFANTSITSNNVNGLKITADFVTERVGEEGWRIRAIGSVLGVINSAHGDITELDLSSNILTLVEIVADKQTFSYAYYDEENAQTIEKYTLGAGENNCYGSSYWYNLGKNVECIKNPTNQSKVTYTTL